MTRKLTLRNCSHLSPITSAYRLAIVLATSAQLAGTASAQPLPIGEQASSEALTDGLFVSPASAENLDEEKIRVGLAAIRKGEYGNIHSVLIFGRGKLVSESYFPGEDENNHQGKIGLVEHGRELI